MAKKMKAKDVKSERGKLERFISPAAVSPLPSQHQTTHRKGRAKRRRRRRKRKCSPLQSTTGQPLPVKDYKIVRK